MNEILREYVRGVLSEGKYDSFARALTNKIIYSIKDPRKSKMVKSKGGSFMNAWDVPWPFEDEHHGLPLRIVVDYVLQHGDETDLSVGGEYGVADGDVPYIKVEIDGVTTKKTSSGKPDVSPILSHIHKNVISSIAHELEHILQHNFTQPGAERPTRDDVEDYDQEDDENVFQYLTDPTEVEAHVKGMYLMAKKARKPLGAIMRQFVARYEDVGSLDRMEAMQVFVMWRKWAKKNLPAADLDTKKVAAPA